MKASFRQSMAWLHTWSGLGVGWILYFVFLTGTAGYLTPEIDRWMRPELPLASKAAASETLPMAWDQLQRRAPDASVWLITLPGRRQSEVIAGWKDQTGEYDEVRVLPGSGELSTQTARDTGGGATLYAMHFELHYMPHVVGLLVVGVCAMFMFTAILTGVVTHKRIFRDLFTFRPGMGQRSLLDAHNLLGVTTLPFLLMITWSGLVLSMFLYLPIAVTALYPEGPGRQRLFVEQEAGEDRTQPLASLPPDAGPTPLAPFGPALQTAEAEFGSISEVKVRNPNQANARLEIYAGRGKITEAGAVMMFDGVTGRPLRPRESAGLEAGFLISFLRALHVGSFADPILRVLFVLAGLAGAAIVATGLLHWSAKRRRTLSAVDASPRSHGLVEVLNVGTIVGVPIGIAAYLWANRLLPVWLESRAQWEVHVLFLAWGVALVFAAWRPRRAAWTELSWAAAAAWGLAPVLNAATTSRHLGVTIPAGDWVLASLDLGMVGIGLLFAGMARAGSNRERLEVAAETTPSGAVA